MRYLLERSVQILTPLKIIYTILKLSQYFQNNYNHTWIFWKRF